MFVGNEMQVRLGKRTTSLVSRANNINGWQNRAIYGASALVSQPFFDYKNPSVDSTTQKYSLIKTLVKIVVGTSVGLASRVPFQKLGEHLYDKGVFKAPKIQNLDNARFKSCVGNVFSIIGAVAAMFSVDIIISNALISFLNKKFDKKGGKNA